ncbi:conserved hypothetical protein [Ignisphaera aggregans DSM 17230]|uniref:Uncharacterized protein n=1 Tax=Ignisphaera aggregans (strain DSM 17230 / JCM 13409 / AQ1.S1) TaxID=583356 RepID=E0SP20_IGNAA|nr:conserved hypothetical protein [Ignisphaera aggregans DSM 17230]
MILVLVLVMLSNVLVPAITPAIASTGTTDAVLLKRVVVVSIDEKGKLLLNITWINQTIEFGNGTCGGNYSCACISGGTCPAIPYSVDINVIYNVSEKEESLELLKAVVYNESFSYSFYVLVYRAERNQYNVSVVTEIMPINVTYLFITAVNIAPRDDKAQPVADAVFLVNKTTLADHYRLLGDVLNEIRKNDTTSLIWNKVKIELNNLAKRVEKDLADYNVVGIGIATAMNGVTVCAFPLGVLITFECLDPRAPINVVVAVCCGSLYSIVVTCAFTCIGSLGIGCIGCIVGGALAAWAAMGGCYGYCPAMEVCLKVPWIFGWITVVCARLR